MADPRLRRRAAGADLKRLTQAAGLSGAAGDESPEDAAEREAITQFFERLERGDDLASDALDSVLGGRPRLIDRLLAQLSAEEMAREAADGAVAEVLTGGCDSPTGASADAASPAISASEWERQQVAERIEQKLQRRMGRRPEGPGRSGFSPGGDGVVAPALGAAVESRARLSDPAGPAGPDAVSGRDAASGDLDGPPPVRERPPLTMGDPQRYDSGFRVNPDRPCSTDGALLRPRRFSRESDR